jgi:hypothetical protein
LNPDSSTGNLNGVAIPMVDHADTIAFVLSKTVDVVAIEIVVYS